MLPEPEGARRTGGSGHHDLGAPLNPRLSKQHERNPRSELGDHKRPRHERPTAGYADHGANCPNHDEPRPKGSDRPPPPPAGQAVPHHLTQRSSYPDHGHSKHQYRRVEDLDDPDRDDDSGHQRQPEGQTSRTCDDRHSEVPTAASNAVPNVDAATKLGEELVNAASGSGDTVAGLSGALSGSAPIGEVLGSSEADLLKKFGREPSHDGDTTGRG